MKTTLTKAALLASVAVVAAACSEVEFPNIMNGQGEIAGEATMTSVVLQSRLTVGNVLVEGDLPGVEGTAHFELSTTSGFEDSSETDWMLATPGPDGTSATCTNCGAARQFAPEARPTLRAPKPRRPRPSTSKASASKTSS